MRPAETDPVSETPAELVLRLTSDGLESLRDDVDAGRREHALKSLDERGGAQELVQDQYAGRYPLELVQNANDAAGSPGATGGRLQFVLTDSALLVADEGSGFENDQVNAICSLGRSSKDPRKSIGYKGLGFKSVNEITCEPQIFAPQVQFGFDREHLKQCIENIAGELPHDIRLPDYAFPFPVETQQLRADSDVVDGLLNDGFRTVMRLPVRHGVERDVVEDHILETVVPQLLLFLDSTNQIRVEGTRHDFDATVIREASNGCDEVLLEANDETRHFILFSETVPVTSRHLVENLGEAWSRVEAVRLSAAIPLDADGSPVWGVSESLHVYFPTEELTGLPIVLSADFQTELDRRRISRTAQAEPYNEWLVAELAVFLATQVYPKLYERFYDHPGIVRTLAPVGALSTWGTRFREILVEHLSEIEFIPCRDGKLRRPGDVKLLPSNIPNMAFAQSLLPHWGHLVEESLNSDSTVRKMLKSDFGVNEYPPSDVVRALAQPPDDQIQEYYEFLVRWSHASSWGFDALLKQANCVRLIDGSWCSPSDLVFFPRQRGAIGFPEDLHVPIVDLPDVEDVKELLESAGVRPFEWRLLIPDFLMPILRDPSGPEELRELAMTALRDYYESERGTDETIRSAVRGTLVRVANSARNTSTLKPAGATYFGAGWLPAGSLLERIYGPFGETEFLAEEMSADRDEQNAQASFYAWLGVETKPRQLDLARESATSAQAHGSHPSSAQLSHWHRSDAFRQASICAQGHPQSQVLDSSPTIDRIADIIDAGDWDRLRALWELLARHWDTCKAGLTATYRCTASAHRGERNRAFASVLSSTLRDCAWVPAQVGGQPTLAQPEQVWLASPQTPVAVLNSLTTLVSSPGTSRSICESLGLVDVERPTALALIGLLSDLEAELRDSPGEGGPAIEVVARWAMAKLDTIISAEDVDGELTVPLLARRAGAVVFDQNPYVTENSILAETWEDQIPILDGDKGLRRLVSVLELRDLETEVQTEPLVVGRDAIAEAKVSRHLQDVSPYLLALAGQNAPWRMSSVRDALAELDVVCAQHLSLKYALGDMTRERDEPTAYLDWHRQGGERRSGIAYLELDAESGLADWFSFGPQLADFVEMPTLGDGFAVLLDANASSRHRFAMSRRLSPDMIDSARALLAAGPANESVMFVDPEADGDAFAHSDTETWSEAAAALEPGEDSKVRNDAIEPSIVSNFEHADSEFLESLPERVARPHASTLSGSAANTSPVEGSSSAIVGSISPLSGLAGNDSKGEIAAADSDQPPDADQEQNRFYTYVVPSGTREARMARRADNPAPHVDRAGVDRVLAYERAAGRIPEEQVHGNPGFDVLSRDGNGSVTRIIEVKSTSGRWAERGVPVSKTQVSENEEQGDRFWLYVVEYATDPANACVTAIQNPLAKVDYFVFDRGWQVLGELS